MKLLRCYIENFGKLHQFEYTFNEKLNIILQDNGWGKTTFATFIKAMLFGLPATTKKDLDDNERNKYMPWQQGAYGGWLEFELKDKDYRIERFFYTPASKDTVKIYDLATNNLVEDENFVANSLKIDANTFARSAFIQQGLFSNADNSSIKQRLTKLITLDDTLDYNAMDKKLEAKQKAFQLERGKGGTIYKMETELNEAKANIELCANTANRMREIDHQIDIEQLQIQAINQSLALLEEQKEQLKAKQISQARIDNVSIQQNELNELVKEQNELLQFFVNNPPSNAKIQELSEWQKNCTTAQIQLDSIKIECDSLEQKLQEFSIFENDQLPTQQKLDNIAQLIHNKQTSEKITNLSTKALEHSHNKKSMVTSCAGVLGAITLILTIFFAIIGSKALSTTFGIVTALIVFGVLIYSIVYNRLNSPIKSHTENRISQCNNFSADSQASIDEFFAGYNILADNDNEKMNILKNQIIDYKNAKNRLQELATQQKMANRQYTRYYNALYQYYEEFFETPQNFEDNLDKTKEIVSKIRMYNEAIEKKQASLQQYLDKTSNAKTDEHITSEQVEEMQASIKQQEQELISKKKTYQENINSLTAQIYSMTETRSNLGFYQQKAEKLTQNIATAQKEYNIIKQTRYFLAQAQNNLTSKYLKPISDAFLEYANRFADIQFADVSINTDLNIAISDSGQYKDIKHYSSGTRDIIELSLRLALINILYEKDTPPLILDDPFYNLDDNKIESAMTLLQDLSEDFQIIYFVCHSSRA